MRTISRPRILLFSRAPIGGAVKTRLAREMGTVSATMWYRRALARTLSLLARHGFHAELHAAPSAAVFRAVFPTAPFALRDQVAGDLGRRMGLAAKCARGATIIIGSDIPDLSQAILRGAQEAVQRFDLVIGPARDGGYYLVGLKSPAHAFRLYAHVRWSGAHALADTLRNAPRHWRIGFLPMLSDVDDRRDLQAIRPDTSPRTQRRCSSSRGMISTKLQGR